MVYTKILPLYEYNLLQQQKLNQAVEEWKQGKLEHQPVGVEYYIKPYAHYGYVAFGDNCARWFKRKSDAIDFVLAQDGICPHCFSLLEERMEVIDYHDPSDTHGHGQYDRKVVGCPNCDYILD